MTGSPGRPFTPPQRPPSCLDVLERRRDVLQQHLWPPNVVCEEAVACEEIRRFTRVRDTNA